MCDSHFAHQQLRVEVYIAEGEWGRKVSTPKQLAVTLSTKCANNTTVLLVKPKHDCSFMAAKVSPMKGISTYLAAHYDHHSETRQVSFQFSQPWTVCTLLHNKADSCSIFSSCSFIVVIYATSVMPHAIDVSTSCIGNFASKIFGIITLENYMLWIALNPTSIHERTIKASLFSSSSTMQSTQ